MTDLLNTEQEKATGAFQSETAAHEWITEYALLHFTYATEHVEEKVMAKLQEALDSSEI